LQPTLLAYKAIEHRGDRLIVLTELEAAELVEPAAGPAREANHREYLVGEELRALWDKVVESLRPLDPALVVHPTSRYLAFRLEGRNFAALTPRRHSIGLDTLTEDGRWDWHEIKTEADLAEAIGRAAAAKERVSGK
jgi:predicted transport protein